MQSNSSSFAPTKNAASAEDSEQIAAPSVSLPRGGGAVKGIGEKFDVNPATGAGSMSIPIATSPGRSGYGPQLALSYSSGAGNGSFGLGWGLALPQVTRKTDKGLPKYHDCTESDVFLLSGAEDLVPVVDETYPKSCGSTDKNANVREVAGLKYEVTRYRPRIEGLFARIERWVNLDDRSDVHWRSYSKTNDLTIYGKDSQSRIADPKNSARIFSWLICESRDTKGNVVLYEYKSEDGKGVDVCKVHEGNRGAASDPRRTANRYIKRIRYGNRESALNECGNRPHFLKHSSLDWMFEVVFDYGEHDSESPTTCDAADWLFREDPFSSYRSRFEIRTTRRCQRVLMFHHFPDEDGVGQDCLVRSTDFQYDARDLDVDQPEPVYSRIIAVTQAGYKRKACGGYTRRTLPPLEFEYTRPVVQETIETVGSESMQNLPIGLDGSNYRWVDLHGEGISGILTEQAGNWYYKQNLSPLTTGRSSSYGSPVESDGLSASYPDVGTCEPAKSDCRDVSGWHQKPVARFAPTTVIHSKPNASLAGGAQLLDLAGDGTPDLVSYGSAAGGFYEHEETSNSWKPFRAFKRQLNRNLGAPNGKFIDLTGDGRADLLITENDSLVWYESEGENGYVDRQRVAQALDEETGPRVIFADAEQSIYTADLSGDGLTDIVRIRNGVVCYWPNTGYCHFGAKITMDNAPRFDDVDQFDHQRIRLADIDGSGTTDIIYLHRDGVRLHFNQSGNRWSKPRKLNVFPKIDNLKHIVPLDLLGNGTTCLVWSSPLLADSNQPMKYINLMGGTKPHLLIKSKNNLGAETEIQYVPSTKFYLQDKRDGTPWITRLPFPVHVVERVVTRDRISGNQFVARYAYHHGYFDGKEREFRGFGMVEQFDTEEFAFLNSATGSDCPSNIDAASHVPPVLTKTWFHTGAYLGRNRISNYFAGFLDQHDRGEYYREPADCCSDEDAKATLGLLQDTILPCDLTFQEEREACRALKGSMLRQEVYALDGSGTCEYPHGHPYTVTEQNFTVRKLQSQGDQRHGVFFTHPREVINYHYERNPVDPRISHALTLEVDDYGNILKDAAIAYGRRKNVVTIDRLGRKRVAPNPELAKLDPHDQAKQTQTQITFTENQFTNKIDFQGDTSDHYLTPQPAGTNTYELTGVCPPEQVERFSFDQWTQDDFAICRCAKEIPYESTTNHQLHQKRLIESVRTRYRSDDLASILLDGQIEPRMLTCESFKLAFTPGLIDETFTRSTPDSATEMLLPNPSDILAVAPNASAADRGGYVDLDGDGCWWIPTGRTYLSSCATDSPEQELQFAQQHFFLDRRYRDPFHTDLNSTETAVKFDQYDLLVHTTLDPVGNSTQASNDYRVLQPKLVTDPNGNRSAVAFDALGMVVGTAVMGKESEDVGDSLEGFEADLSEEVELQHLANPHQDSQAILSDATTRLVYDLFAYHRTAESDNPQPAMVYTVVRETHVHLNTSPTRRRVDQEIEKSKVQHSFSYSDGFGREIQKKAQAEPGKVPLRDDLGKILVDENNQPIFGEEECQHRWVGSGWTIFNNKGKPVRKFEPYFTDRYRFESDTKIGVSPVLFYDPVERVIATLHPNQTYEKVLFDPWKQITWDVNDTVLLDPRTDPDIAPFVTGWTETLPNHWQTWCQQRVDPQPQVSDKALAVGGATTDSSVTDRRLAPCRSQNGTVTGNRRNDRIAIRQQKLERQAAEKTAAHANTPTVAYLDSLGRTFITVTHNRVVCPHHDLDGSDELYPTRVEFDIEGNQRSVRDSIVQNDDQLGRIAMTYDYDMLGNRIHQLSMEAGERWTLNDVAGNPIRAWDSRGHKFTSHYDSLRRPMKRYLSKDDRYEPQSKPAALAIAIDGSTEANAQTANSRTVPPSDDLPELAQHLIPESLASKESERQGASRRYPHSVIPPEGGTTNGTTSEPLLIERVIYGEQHPDTANRNLRGQAFMQLDQAGAVATEQFDFKGNAVSQSRRIAKEFRQAICWDTVDSILPVQHSEPLNQNEFEKALAALCEEEIYCSSAKFDALNRQIEQVTPHTNEMKPNVIRHRFNEANLLDQIDANLRSETKDGELVWTSFVENIDYDAKGQRERIDYGNGSTTLYKYDPLTFRLAKMLTQRNRKDFPGDSPNPPHDGWPGKDIQNLNYTYDPVGNISHIQDDAQQTIFFRNKRVEPSNDYTYDAIYRLIEATGREHLGQVGGSPIPHSHNDGQRVGLLHPGDGNAMGRYVERYIYDSVGNFIEMQHRGMDPQHRGWTREYSYNEVSLAEHQKQNNRLSYTQLRGGTPASERYKHDAHGNMTFMPHLGRHHSDANMHWDHDDRLRSVDLQESRAAYYTYNKSGIRIRKLVLLSESIKDGFDERLYFENLELSQSKVNGVSVVSETLSIGSEAERFGLIETRFGEDGMKGASESQVKYQVSNHLKSISISLDSEGRIISSEEYFPYGETSFVAHFKKMQFGNRYRFHGKERDDETGLAYFSRRFYSTTIGRWTSCDPMELVDGPSLYVFCKLNPSVCVDREGTYSTNFESDIHQQLEDLDGGEKPDGVFWPKVIGWAKGALKYVFKIKRPSPPRYPGGEIADDLVESFDEEFRKAKLDLKKLKYIGGEIESLSEEVRNKRGVAAEMSSDISSARFEKEFLDGKTNIWEKFAFARDNKGESFDSIASAFGQWRSKFASRERATLKLSLVEDLKELKQKRSILNRLSSEMSENYQQGSPVGQLSRHLQSGGGVAIFEIREQHKKALNQVSREIRLLGRQVEQVKE